MFIPLGDDVPRTRPPYATFALVLTNVLVHLVQRLLPADAAAHILYAAGAIPYEVAHFTDITDEVLHAPAIAPPPLTIVTSLFLHGSVEHLVGNAWFLWVFGRGVEAGMGVGRFLVFYLLVGIIAAVVQVAATPWSQIPMVGASGAIAGVLGAYLLMHPRARVQILLFLLVIVQIVMAPSFIVLPVWVLWQVIGNRGDIAIATWAHVGGFGIGALACKLFARPWTHRIAAAGSWSPR